MDLDPKALGLFTDGYKKILEGDPNNATARRSSKDRAFAFLQKSL